MTCADKGNLIFILGIDALDCELVEKLNLNNLKQLEYGKVVVPLNKKRGRPLSPEVWASFLIGEYMPVSIVSSSHYKNVIRNLLAFFHLDLNNIFVKKTRDFFINLGFTSPARFGNLNRETFLDITKSKEINVPFYSFDHKTFDVSHLFGISGLSLRQAVKEIYYIYEMRKKQIIGEIESMKNNDIVFAFMHTTDVLQHLSLHFSEIKQHYIDLDNYVSVLKTNLEYSFEDVIFIIVSDHGFDFNIGTHSMEGFYSSNVNLIPKPTKITEFYGIISDLLRIKCYERKYYHESSTHPYVSPT